MIRSALVEQDRKGKLGVLAAVVGIAGGEEALREIMNSTGELSIMDRGMLALHLQSTGKVSHDIRLSLQILRQGASGMPLHKAVAMSYCRWSSDHFDCDVYVYEDVRGGWTTHVAGWHRRNPLPDEIRAMYPDWSESDAPARYMAAEAASAAWIASQPHDEYTMNTVQPDGTTAPRVYRSLKDSEYFDLAEFGPEAGTTANHPSPGECADYLDMLKAKGFNVPQYAIDALREEAAELCSPSSSSNLSHGSALSDAGEH